MNYYLIYLDYWHNERALTRERILAGLETANKRGRRGGSKIIDTEKMEAILESLNSGASKASVCRNFGLKRSTLYDTLNRNALTI